MAAAAAPAAVAAIAAAPQARDCSLSVASFPWSELWIDGKDTWQRTPVVRLPVTCGEHKLGLRGSKGGDGGELAPLRSWG